MAKAVFSGTRVFQHSESLILAVIAAAVILSPGSAPAQTGPAELQCRKATAALSARYLKRNLEARQRCLRSALSGKILDPEECLSGDPQGRFQRDLAEVEAQIADVVPRKCGTANFTFLGYPGPCVDDDGNFTSLDLMRCVTDNITTELIERLRVQYPDFESAPDEAGRCINGVGRRASVMLRKELRARHQCLLMEETLGGIGLDLDCRDPLPPYAKGTSDSETDRRIARAYIQVLSGVPASCRGVDVSQLDYSDRCDTPIGRPFDVIDLKTCVFYDLLETVDRFVDVAFPSEPVCGDGVVAGDEECDDANDVDSDACVACALAVCGDGVVQTGFEDCDDGNLDQTDACSNDCTLAVCGDGFVQRGVEQCDDGNTDDADACLSNCRDARCGDGVVCTDASTCTSGPLGGIEQCDPPAVGGGVGTCNDNCSLSVCGDGFVGAGEECDEGSANSQTMPDACRADCTDASCGDGVIDSGEGCEPPGTELCDAQCLPILCGNGSIDPGEECDDGAANSDTEPDACRRTCRNPSCGDGIVDPAGGEECDDSNAVDADGCLSSCKSNVCGDGVRNPLLEQCDDGNAVEEDSCLNDCTENVCGDGILNPDAEACEDGNADDGDPCRNNCEIAICGDGAVCASGVCVSGPAGGPEACDDGAANSDNTPDACRSDCALPVCGDGVVDSGEGCDDGPGNSDTEAGACPTSCTAPSTCEVLFSVTNAVTVGALQFEIDYGAADGEFVGEGVAVECTNLIRGTFGAIIDDDSARVIGNSLIAPSGFVGPADVMSCNFATAGDAPLPSAFVIRVLAASDPDLGTIDPTVEATSIVCENSVARQDEPLIGCPSVPVAGCIPVETQRFRLSTTSIGPVLRWTWRSDSLTAVSDSLGADRPVDSMICVYPEPDGDGITQAYDRRVLSGTGRRSAIEAPEGMVPADVVTRRRRTRVTVEGHTARYAAIEPMGGVRVQYFARTGQCWASSVQTPRH